VKKYLQLIVCLVLSFQAFKISAEIDNSQDLLETAADISFISQQIAKSYFYVNQNIQRNQASQVITNSVKILDQRIEKLNNNYTAEPDSEEANMLLFLSFTRDELKETLSKKYSKNQGALILDFSETLLEGANLIVDKNINKQDKGQATIVIIKRMGFLLERISKYYIAFKAGYNDFNNLVQQRKAIEDFEMALVTISEHPEYAIELKQTLAELNKFWPIAKKFYNSIEVGNTPRLVFTSTAHLEKMLKNIERHHYRQNK